ncbi:MFS transporter [Streptomyces sp. TRM64462]|uniref:MFS transporter n=1 Tax=Streptomyces sp. TRM64462 TaxID=2741726 RepID=UPI0020C79981|nr:MFS transporter [Streptomyces sp. TRM64462]
MGATDEADRGGTRAWRGLSAELAGRPVVTATALAAVLHVAWFLWAANSGGDLAAQDAWAEFAGRYPDSAYNLAWYGGMHPVSYSVLSPYVMALIGVRTTMMAAGTVSAGLVALILVRTDAVRNVLACSLAAVFALLCNAASGRVTFGLGLMVALGAVAALYCRPPHGRGVWGVRSVQGVRVLRGAAVAALSGLATAASPVAGLFLGVVAAALFLTGRRLASYAVGLPPVAVVGLSAWLFPFSGTQPMAFGTAALPVLFGILAVVLVPREWRTLRAGAGFYAVGTLLTWLFDSQIGSNVTRLPMLFAGVVLLAALPYAARECRRRSRRWYALVTALVVFHAWVGFKSVDDVVRTAPQASWAHDAAPLVEELRRRGADQARVEVVPARSHREASALAPYVSLARGWNRQADLERNPLFYDGSLNAANYRAWLHRWAVRYVVLPTGGTPDTGAREETALVAAGLPYLEPVWSDAHWRLYAVQDPTPLAAPDATVSRTSPGGLTLRVTEPGRILIRVPYSPWLSLVDAEGRRLAATPATGCLREAPQPGTGDTWTELTAPKAGVYHLGSPYSLFARGTAC